MGLDFGEIVREPRFVIGHWEGRRCAFICGGMLPDYSMAMSINDAHLFLQMSTQKVTSALFGHEGNPFIVSIKGGDRVPRLTKTKKKRPSRSPEEVFEDYINTYHMPVGGSNEDWKRWYDHLTKPENMRETDLSEEEGDLHRLTTLDEFWADDALQYWVKQRLSDLRLYDRNR